jgi:hypothetical protein
MPSYNTVKSLTLCVTTDLTYRPRLVVPRRQRVQVTVHTPLLATLNSALCEIYKPSEVVCFAYNTPASKMVDRLCPKGLCLHSMGKTLPGEKTVTSATKQLICSAKVCVLINVMIPLDEMMDELRDVDIKFRLMRQSSQLYGGLQLLVVSSVYGISRPRIINTNSGGVKPRYPHHDWIVLEDNEETIDTTNNSPASCLDQLTDFLFDGIMSACSGPSTIGSEELQETLCKLQRVCETNAGSHVVTSNAVHQKHTIHILPSGEINKVIENNIAYLPTTPGVFNKIQSKRSRPKKKQSNCHPDIKIPYITDAANLGVPDYCKYRFVVGMRVFACYPTGFKRDPSNPNSGRFGTIVHIKGSMMTELDPVVQWDVDRTLTVTRRITHKCPTRGDKPGFTSTFLPLAPAYAVTWEHLIDHEIYTQPGVSFVVHLYPFISTKHTIYLYWLAHQIHSVVSIHVSLSHK